MHIVTHPPLHISSSYFANVVAAARGLLKAVVPVWCATVLSGIGQAVALRREISDGPVTADVVRKVQVAVSRW